MAHDPPANRFSLRRWSERKLDAARQRDAAVAGPAARGAGASEGAVATQAPGPAHARPAVATPPDARDPAALARAPSPALPRDMGAPAASVQSDGAGAPAAAESSLPPIESLTIESDFQPFMQAGIDENVRRDALKRLFRSPQFNVMDGLDVYIDDYSLPSPLAPEIVRTLMQARYIFDPPKTRVNAEGHVEDVVPEEPALADATRSEEAARADGAAVPSPPDSDAPTPGAEASREASAAGVDCGDAGEPQSRAVSS